MSLRSRVDSADSHAIGVKLREGRGMGAIAMPRAMAGRPLRGALTADVRNFGATEDDAGPAVREILETFALGDPIRVWFPTGKWLFREPIIVGRKRVEFCGESPVATTLAMADYGP